MRTTIAVVEAQNACMAKHNTKKAGLVFWDTAHDIVITL